MNRYGLTFIIVLSTAVIVLGTPTAALAVPPLPSSFYGMAKLNAANVPDGTLVQALINDKVVAYSQTQTYQGDSVYSLDIPGDDPGSAAIDGGVDNDKISFKIGGILAAQTGVWLSATNVKLDLSASSANTPLPPQPTATDLPTQTPIPAGPTQAPPAQPSLPTLASPVQPVAPTAAPTLAADQAAISPTDTHQAASQATPAAPTQPNPQVSSPGRAPAGTSVTSLAVATSITIQTQVALSTEPASARSAVLETLNEKAGSATQKTNSYWILIPVVILIGGLIAFWFFRRSK